MLLLLLMHQEDGNQVHAQQMVLQLLKGLHHINEKGILLRDVKPDNVLVEHEGSLSEDNERFTARYFRFRVLGLGFRA